MQYQNNSHTVNRSNSALYLSFYSRYLEIKLSTGLFIAFLDNYPRKTNLYKAVTLYRSFLVYIVDVSTKTSIWNETLAILDIKTTSSSSFSWFDLAEAY